ncbi:zinc finger, CCHC-type containing protein [Tanacetum coccineum]|uniref:Zinc finger, CCHC-type containing protein n=1 Tax=Tanacetum coccineum TaxID=301880 RepID=A0ABQ5E7I4_9ASTR
MKSCKEIVKIRVCKGGAWERVDGALEYMPLNCVKRTLILPLLSSYSCLLEAVSERLEIDANSRFMVTYNSDNDIVEVCDDLKVNEFMEFVVKSSRIVTLCIVDSSVNGRQSSTTGSNQQSNFIHAIPSVDVYQTEYHATQIHQTQMLVFPVSGGFYQNIPSYQQMHEFSENHVYLPGFLGYPMHDPQSDSANRKNKQVVGSPKHKKPSVFWKVKRLSGEDESSEYDDESSESDDESGESDEDEETTLVENKNWTPEESFAELPLYCHNLKLKNPGTITHIETDDQDRFEILYLASCQRNDEHKHELTPWAEAKLAQRIAKSSTWTVRPAANYLYNVVDYYKNATVNLNTRTCSCGQWQLSGLPCGHLIAVMRHLCQSSANQFAFSCFKTSVWRASYKEIIYDVGHPSEWEKPDGLITVLPPLMDKRPPGRPRNRDRFRSKGEQIKQKSCTRCFRGGHNRRDCPSMVPSQIFIPTTSSVKSGSSTSMRVSKTSQESSWNEEI